MIKFGTDGWRGVIADDFTFDNVRLVAGAIAAYVLKHEDARRGLIVGYDTRFASPRAARAVAEVLASAGIPSETRRTITLQLPPFHWRSGAQSGRRCRHHLQPQSMELEWGEVQRQVWRFRARRPS